MGDRSRGRGQGRGRGCGWGQGSSSLTSCPFIGIGMKQDSSLSSGVSEKS